MSAQTARVLRRSRAPLFSCTLVAQFDTTATCPLQNDRTRGYGARRAIAQ